MSETFKSVGEMMSYFTNEEMIQESFSERLMAAYPQLFPKDADGKLKEPDCGVWCPVGWQPMVETLCESINHHVENNKTWIPKYVKYHAVCSWIHKYLFIHQILTYVSRAIDPVVYPPSGFLPSSKADELRKASPILTQLVRRVWKLNSFLRPTRRFTKKTIPPVTILQVKEKFGGLRFYYSGGDGKIEGMVSFAEQMSYKICEETGERGYLCSKNGWLRTLSISQMCKYGYTRHN
jgi:hypothetical protein